MLLLSFRLEANVGNETADQAAKQAITEGEQIESQNVPRNIVRKRLIDRVIAKWNHDWDNVNTGRATYNVFNTADTKSKYAHISPEYRRKLLNRAASGHFPVNTF